MLNSMDELEEIIDILRDYKEVLTKITFETNVVVIECEPKYVSVIHEELINNSIDSTNEIIANYGNIMLQAKEF